MGRVASPLGPRRDVPQAPLIVALLTLVVTLAACGAPAPPVPPPTSAPPAPARYPADVLNLSNWYLTLPTGTAGAPDNVYPPELLSFSDAWFRLNDARDGVVFTANAGGATTKGSNYPRSELREMRGGELASWSNANGTHTMTVRQAITRLPQVKPHVVSAQIHDAQDDVVEIRLEGQELIAQYDDGGTDVTIEPAYVLGTPYDLQITAANSMIAVHYNGRLAAEIPVAGDGWYFKAGSYVQSNPQRGDAPDAMGEVVIHSLGVEHSV